MLRPRVATSRTLIQKHQHILGLKRFRGMTNSYSTNLPKLVMHAEYWKTKQSYYDTCRSSCAMMSKANSNSSSRLILMHRPTLQVNSSVHIYQVTAPSSYRNLHLTYHNLPLHLGVYGHCPNPKMGAQS